MGPDKQISRFWTCGNPDKHWEGKCYATLRPAVSSARLRNEYVVVETFSLINTATVSTPKQDPRSEEDEGV